MQLHSRKQKGLPKTGGWSGEVRFTQPRGGEDSPTQDVRDANAEKEIDEGEHCLIFLCGDKTQVPHQIGFQR